MTNDHDELFKAAVASDRLAGRIAANRAYAGADFERWLRQIIGQIPFANALDLCCGTGNQLVLYGERRETESLVGVDLSPASLARARERLDAAAFGGTVELIAADIESVFAREDIAARQFELASCCYGLYYASHTRAVLDAMIDRLEPGGTCLIVGPYGPNNAALFELLGNHMTLPELVVRSATTFMTDEVAPYLKDRTRLRTETFVNPVRYPSADTVMAYWRKTTFHDESKEVLVRQDLDAHFAQNDAFVVEKHVMAAIARS